MQNRLYEGNGFRIGVSGSCEHDNLVIVPAKEPTCTEDGWYAYNRCADCGQEFAVNSIPATGHKWKAATCTSPMTCSVCGAMEGASAAHDWDGKPSCSVCGQPNPNYHVEAKPTSPPSAETESATPVPGIPAETNTVEVAPKPTETVGEIWGTEEERETVETTGVPDTGFLESPFAVDSWLDLASIVGASVLIGVVIGWYLNSFLQKKK